MGFDLPAALARDKSLDVISVDLLTQASAANERERFRLSRIRAGKLENHGATHRVPHEMRLINSQGIHERLEHFRELRQVAALKLFGRFAMGGQVKRVH